MSKNHRIAIVGVGAIAGMHARAIADIDSAELVAANCRTEEKGRKFTKEFGGQWYGNYEELFDSVKPDIVSICTPSGAHLEPVVAALDRGIHVICEKPIEVNLDRARQMIAATEKSTARLGGIFPQRFSPVVQSAHEAAKAGRLGPLGIASAYVPWWRDEDYYAPSRWQGTIALDGGGALINQSIHAVDAMLWLAEAAGAGRAVEVFGYTAQRGHEPDLIEVEDAAVATVRFESGALGVILASTAMWPGTSMRFHLGGRDGTIEIHEKELVTFQFRESLPSDEVLIKQFGATEGDGGASDPMAIDYSNHTRNIEDFLAAIEEDRPSLVDAGEAWKSLAVIRAAYESQETGKPVAVESLG